MRAVSGCGCRWDSGQRRLSGCRGTQFRIRLRAWLSIHRPRSCAPSTVDIVRIVNPAGEVHGDLAGADLVAGATDAGRRRPKHVPDSGRGQRAPGSPRAQCRARPDRTGAPCAFVGQEKVREHRAAGSRWRTSGRTAFGPSCALRRSGRGGSGNPCGLAGQFQSRS